MKWLAALSTGTKLMLASSSLLLLDLFMTWQKVPQEYGGKFDVTSNLDAWDGAGLILALITAALLTLVVLRATSVEFSSEVRWGRVALGLSAAMFLAAVVKNLLDDYSAWASYAGVALAWVCVVGAYLDRDRVQTEQERPLDETWKPRVRASQADVTANGAGGRVGERRTGEPHASDANRW
jgi:hypothetical protein